MQVHGQNCKETPFDDFNRMPVQKCVKSVINVLPVPFITPVKIIIFASFFQYFLKLSLILGPGICIIKTRGGLARN